MIRAIRFTPSSDAEAARGLLAYVKLEYGPLILDGITLRRHASGRLGLAFPERTDGHGRRHPLVRPINDAARVEIEEEVLRELNRQELERGQATASGDVKR